MARGVIQEGFVAVSSVAAAGCVAIKRPRTGGGVGVTVGVEMERFKTVGCVRDAGGEAKQGILTLSCIVIRIASIWRWRRQLCLRRRRKRKADDARTR